MEKNDAQLHTGSVEARDVLCLSLIAASVLVAWQPLASVLRLAFHSDEYTHVILILPISVALIYLERHKLRRGVAYAPAAGAVVAAFSTFLAIAAMTRLFTGNSGVNLSITVFSLVLFWMACIVGCFGRAVFWSLLFPSLFLFLMVPPPAFVLDKAISFLQTASTQATFALFNIAGLPVLKNGFVLSFPTLQIEVAKECSGIRSSIMLLLTGLILGHLFLRSLWTKLVFVFLILPLSVLKNAIRIFTLATLGMYVDSGFLHGSLHHDGGIVFFLLALFALMLLLWILQRVGKKKAPLEWPSSQKLQTSNNLGP